MVAEGFRHDETGGEDRREALVDAYYWAARFFAEHDQSAFEATVEKIRGLVPSFVPPAPVRLRQLSRLLGYATAERIAVKYRKLKRFTKAVRA